MSLEGIIFDLDGVLVDTVPAHYAAWHRLFTEEGYYFDEQIYHDKVDGRRRLDGVRGVMENIDESRALAAAERKDGYFRALIEEGRFQIFGTSVAFLDQCRNLGLRLATASSSQNVHYILEKAGLTGYFAAIVGGGDVTQGKPAPDIFLLAARKIDLEPRSCIVIEDAASGVAAAKAGGFYCIGIERMVPSDRLAGADAITNDLSEIEISRLCSYFSG